MQQTLDLGVVFPLEEGKQKIHKHEGIIDNIVSIILENAFVHNEQREAHAK